MNSFDLCVIGGGPGGYNAALRAARSGLCTALVEADKLGGVCLNVGCIPTKTLLASAGLLRQIRRAAAFGIRTAGDAEADWPAMLARKDAVTTGLRNGVAGLLKNAGVTVFAGHAAFQDAHLIRINDGERVSARYFLIASGSRPARPAFLPSHPAIVSSDQLLSCRTLPESLLVLGGGVVGCEFAALFAALGVRVTLVEMLPSLLAGFDPECVRVVAMRLRLDGVRLLTGTSLSDVRADENGVIARAGEETVSGTLLLNAAGRRPNTAGLNLEAAGLAAGRRGEIPVDADGRTAVPHIFAAGDVTGEIMLAHWAAAAAVRTAAIIAGETPDALPESVPGCVFTTPEIATAGWTPAECAARHLDVVSGKFPFSALGKAQAAGETEGFVKITADRGSDRILGVAIVGSHASDLISEAAAALAAGMTAGELARTVHPHPTLGEALQEAALAVHGRCLQLPVRRKRSSPIPEGSALP